MFARGFYSSSYWDSSRGYSRFFFLEIFNVHTFQKRLSLFPPGFFKFFPWILKEFLAGLHQFRKKPGEELWTKSYGVFQERSRASLISPLGITPRRFPVMCQRFALHFYRSFSWDFSQGSSRDFFLDFLFVHHRFLSRICNAIPSGISSSSSCKSSRCSSLDSTTITP